MRPGPYSDLKTILAQGGALVPARAVNLVRQIATAVDHAHGQQSVRREITPGSILVGPDDSAYLSDSAGATPSADRTRTLVTDSELAYRADIHALTAVLYECLTGQPPGMPLVRPSQQRADVPAGFDEVIARGMAVDPGGRYSSAAELVAAAQHALAAPQSAPGPSQAATRAFQLPPTSANTPHQPPPWDPVTGRGPTVSFPHSQPIPLPVPLPVPERRRRRLTPVIAGAVIVVAVIIGAVAIPKIVGSNASTNPTTTTTPRRLTYTATPTELPFPGFYPTKNVAVDGAGNVYVLATPVPAPEARWEMFPSKLYKLAPGAAGATTQDVPAINFRSTSDVAVDKAGNLYISDGSQVWMQEAGKSNPIRLPFRGFSEIHGIAVDADGNTYAAGVLMGNVVKHGVKMLIPGDNHPTDLPFHDLYLTRGVAVDKAGNVYVCVSVKGSANGRVLKLPRGANTATPLPIPGLKEPRHVAFNSVGDVFVADGFNRAFFQLPAAGGDAVKLPLPSIADGVAVDSQDNLYLLTSATTDKDDKIVKPGQVLKVAPDK